MVWILATTAIWTNDSLKTEKIKFSDNQNYTKHLQDKVKMTYPRFNRLNSKFSIYK